MLIATPFLTAFGFIGKWLLSRLNTVEAEKNALYAKLIDDVVPALKSSTDQVQTIIEQQRVLAAERETMIAGLERIGTTQQAVIGKLEELWRQELALAKRRGGGG